MATFKQETTNILWLPQMVAYMVENKKLVGVLNWLTWKWTDPPPGKASMRMVLAGWSELKMCSLLKKVYCIFKNNNN